MTAEPLAVDVALPVPISHPLTYGLDHEQAEILRIGSRVRVRLGPRPIIGHAVGPARPLEEGDGALKPIDAVVDERPLLTPELVRLGFDIARHYFHGPGEVLAAMLPAGVRRGSSERPTAVAYARIPQARAALDAWPRSNRTLKQKELLTTLLESSGGIARQTLLRMHDCSVSPLKTLEKKGLVEIRWERPEDDVFARLEIRPDRAPRLSEHQQVAAGAVRDAIERGEHAGFLLHGVTGSGKTEVYLDAIARCLERRRTAIVLVPEISLTPQTVERFESRFGCAAVLHSHLTDAERARQWEELRSGRKLIAIGPRSAIFAPVRDIGLIVLDEEHEATFKQQNVPRYHARDVALMRARIENAVVVLGSATPSLESWEAARSGKLELLSLPCRVTGIPLPAVSVVDLRAEKTVGPGGLFSPVLQNLVARALDRGEQCLLFLNRRGFNTTIVCTKCRAIIECRNCSIPMTFYRSRGALLCHYCGHMRRPPAQCPECGAPTMRFKGFGTEAVEHATKRLFPTARIRRMDSDSMRARNAHERTYEDLKHGRIDILIGTQMVAKGLDIPGITLIGVISADTSLLLPDFRAAERTFQLLTQVAGRAGRGAKPGRVIVQTYSPEHYSLVSASRHDYPGFAAVEAAHRRELGYPPYGVLARIIAQGFDAARVEKAIARIGVAIEEPAARLGVTVLGPAPAPLELVKRRFRHHILLRAAEGERLVEVLEACTRELRRGGKVQILVDRDPTSMM